MKKLVKKMIPKKEEVGSFATLAGASYLAISQFDDPLHNLRQAYRHAQHASSTVYDAIRGGPEGMRAAKSLEDALEMVESASKNNKQAESVLQDYFMQRQEFVKELVRVYKENENMAQVAGRLQLQLEGTLKSFFEVGNDLKPKRMKKLDDAIIQLYGKDPVEARESSGRLKKFYEEVNEFYDARDKNEDTIKQFSNYLEEVKVDSVEKNKRLNDLFASVIARVKEGYETEDLLIESGDRNILGLRTNIPSTQLSNIETKVDQYGSNVESTRSEIGYEIPLKAYDQNTWADYALNPLTLSLVAAASAKGLSKVFLPGVIDDKVSKALALPVTIPYTLGKKAWNKTGSKVVEYITHKLKKSDII